jgi:hypothetical protein
VHRLVIALTTLLALTAGVVLAGYVFIFSAGTDRAARAVPAGAAFYATAYLEPSAGQSLNLEALARRIPGFADTASLDQKIHEITARLLGGTGLDYEADIRPWLGGQLALAVQPQGVDPGAADVLAVIAVKDRGLAVDALGRVAQDLGLDAAGETHQGVELMVSEQASWALLEDLLLVGSSADAVRSGLDADADRASSLADSPRFMRAMGEIPADHLASVYVDLETLGASTDVLAETGGYSTASLALVVDQAGLRLVGAAPFDSDAASDQEREAFQLSREAATLASWMPAGTQAELTMFGLSQSLQAAESQLGSGETGDDLADLLSQLRLVASLGLGVSLDEDVLPLFDRETALALTGLDETTPSGQLLLRPSDAAGAEAALARIRQSLEERGATARDDEVGGIPVTSLALPDFGTAAYAMRDGVIVVGLSAEDVAAAFAAEAGGDSLAQDQRYAAAWELAGARGGNEAWVDAGALMAFAGDDLGVTGEARDILLRADAVAMTAPARPDQNRSEFHVVLTVR